MAELELSIRYRTKKTRIGLILMAALVPVWGLIMPICLGFFLGMLLQNPASVQPFNAFLLIFSLALVPLLSVVLTAICEDDRILISKEGFAFPLFMLTKLKFKREYLWSELQNIHLLWSNSLQFQANDLLTLMFQSSAKAVIQLSQVPKPDLEQLLLALDVWGVNAKKDQQLPLIQAALQNENKGIEHLSYTQMWEEELARRFNATAFIPLAPGKILQSGRIKVVRQLAFGGLSAIYLIQREGKDLYILKEAVIPSNADSLAKEKAAELFERESHFLARLNHPQIAKVLDHFLEDGRHYLLLEYINGQDLRQLVKQNGPQSESVVVNWAKQIASILDYLHHQEPPIIHRDLTPDNLVARDDGSVMLIDFGAANEFIGTATGTLVGKQAYIAPEQFRGKAKTQSDIFALGGTLYFLLTGQDPEPLSVSNVQEICPNVSPFMTELIAKCTALDLEERLTSAKEVISFLDKQVANSSA